MKTKKISYWIVDACPALESIVKRRVEGYAVDYEQRFCVHEEYGLWRADDWATGHSFGVVGYAKRHMAIDAAIREIKRRKARGEWKPAVLKALQSVRHLCNA